MRRRTLLVDAGAALFCGLPHASAKEPRGRAWLIRHVTQAPGPGARDRRYLALIDRTLDDGYLGLDLDFLEKGGANLSRAQTSLIGRLAYCYRTRGLKYYQDAHLLEYLRRAYLAVASHITFRGMFEWLGDTDYYFRPHEQAWRLEPMLLGYIWIADKFPPQDREVIEAALARAADWLVHNPTNETNNRGAVWCAVATLCALYYDRPDYVEQVERYATRIINGAVWEDGEVGEHGADRGGGPDSNYSYTGWAYVYVYRLLSGKDELDARLLTALQWFSLYNTLSGYSVVDGASVRKRVAEPRLADLLPALEHYGRLQPFFAAAAATIVAKLEQRPVFGGHTVSPLLWAMWEQGSVAAPRQEPEWRRNQTRVYERKAVHYALISRRYQTGLVFRAKVNDGGNFPLRGMQSFAFGWEEPILLNTNRSNSSLAADGIETATEDVARGPSGWEIVAANGHDLATFAERRRMLWTVYAFTPVSAIVVCGGARGPITSRWQMHRIPSSPPVLNEAQRTVAFAGRKGRVYCFEGRVLLTPEDVLEVVCNPPLSACAFSNDSLRWGRYEAAAQVLSFSDETGPYRLSLKGVVKPDGTLDRNPAPRLAVS